MKPIQELRLSGSALRHDTSRLRAMQHPKDIGVERAVIGGDDIDPLQIVPRHVFLGPVGAHAEDFGLGQLHDELALAEHKEFLRAFVTGITLHPYEKRGVRHMRGIVAASCCTNGYAGSGSGVLRFSGSIAPGLAVAALEEWPAYR